jgi:hypothetical protein
MDANLSATLENFPEPEGNDIRRAPAGYLVHSGRVIVRAVEVHHMNIRSAGLRTPAGPRPPAGCVDGGLKSLPPGHILCPGGQHTGSAPGPRNFSNRIHRTGLHQSRGRTCSRRPQALAIVGPHV